MRPIALVAGLCGLTLLAGLGDAGCLPAVPSATAVQVAALQADVAPGPRPAPASSTVEEADRSHIGDACRSPVADVSLAHVGAAARPPSPATGSGLSTESNHATGWAAVVAASCLLAAVALWRTGAHG